MTFIAQLFETILSLIVSIFGGAVTLTCGLANLITVCPNFFAIYVEISLVLLFFMAHMLRMRYLQRQIPVPPPQMLLSQAPTPPMPPDRTLPNAILIGAFLVVALLILFSSFA